MSNEKPVQISNEENTCPICNSTDIGYEEPELSTGEIYFKAECHNCQASWLEIYATKFRYNEDIQDKNGVHVQNEDKTRQDIITDEDLEQYLCQYSKDYFSMEDISLFDFCKDLLNLLLQGKFEWDTYETEQVLDNLKNNVNRKEIFDYA